MFSLSGSACMFSFKNRIYFKAGDESQVAIVQALITIIYIYIYIYIIFFDRDIYYSFFFLRGYLIILDIGRDKIYIDKLVIAFELPGYIFLAGKREFIKDENEKERPLI